MKTTIAALAALWGCATGAQAAVTQDQIDYWTAQYSGAELTQPLARCGDPSIPGASGSREAVQDVVRRFARWSACYQAAVDRLTLRGDPINNVPAEVRFGMTVEQYRAAARHMDAVYAHAVDQLAAEAGPVIARYDAWASRIAALQQRPVTNWAPAQIAASYSPGGANYNITRAIR